MRAVGLLTYLYERYRSDVYRYLLSLTKDTVLSEDLLSETFCAAVTGVPKFRGDSQIKTWLFTIARNKWYDHLRRSRIAPDERSLAALYLSDTVPSPEETIHRQQMARRAMELLSMEPERTRKIVWMRIEGYSFLEISEKFGIQEGSARVIDFRARKKLKEKLMEEGYDGSL